MNPDPAHKRVLVVVMHPVGGIRTYILYNYPFLARMGYRFTFCSPDRDVFRQFCTDLGGWEDVEFVAAPTRGRGGKKCMLWRTVRRLLRQRRFCLVHSQGFGAGCHTALANLGLGVPHVITSHGLVHRTEFPGLIGSLKLLMIERLLCRANTVIAVSNDARENHLQIFPRLNGKRNNLITIVNGIDVGRFTADDGDAIESLRKRLGLKPDAFLMGYLGRFMPEKGFLVLVDAIDRLLANGDCPHFHLVAVGSGDYIREYKAKVAARPRLSGCVSFLDHVPNVHPILKQLDLLVMPSLWEACGLLAMEAMAAGIPLVGSDGIGLREVLQGTPSAMPTAGDANALAEVLQKAIVSPWKAASLAYRPLAEQRFDVARSAACLQQLYDEYAAGSQNGK